MSRWAWAEEINESTQLPYVTRTSILKGLHLALLEELFREKQAKIKRLQDCYSASRRPLYEDMRSENYIKDAESLAQSISVLAQRAESYRARTGKTMRHSDGTVMGVPGDQPNVEVGDGWCGGA